MTKIKDSRFLVLMSKKDRMTVDYLKETTGITTNQELWDWMLKTAMFTVETVREKMAELRAQESEEIAAQ